MSTPHTAPAAAVSPFKPGWKSSEFILSAATVAGLLFPALAPIVGIAANVALDPTVAGAIGAVASTYNASRGYVKGKWGKDLPEIKVVPGRA